MVTRSGVGAALTARLPAPGGLIQMPRQYTRTPLAERFWPKVDRNGPIPSSCPGLGPCWLWTATIAPNGYGQTSVDGGRHEYAHRAAWMLVDGPIPDGQGVYHICDTPACVRNDEPGVYVVNGIALPRFGHLFTGTQADNNADRVAKGRTVPRTDWTPARGERNSQAKLTEAQVREIRARYVPRCVTLATLGAEYGVSESAIHSIVRRKNWKV